MKILNIQKDVPWISRKNTLTTIESTRIPKKELVTAVFALVFHEGKVLFADIKHKERGFDIIGGHVEKREPLLSALRREVREETGAEIKNIKMFAYTKIHTLSKQTKKNAKYPYPFTFMVFYTANLKSLRLFKETRESKGGKFFSIQQTKKLTWAKDNKELFKSGIKKILKS